MIISMISLMSRTIMNTTRTLALADPNVIKPFQRRILALSAILSSDFSSRRFIIDILPSGMRCPMALLAMMFSMNGFSTGNMIPEVVQIAVWVNFARGKECWVYILPYGTRKWLYVGWSIVSTNFGIDRNQELWILNMIGLNSLQSL